MIFVLCIDLYFYAYSKKMVLLYVMTLAPPISLLVKFLFPIYGEW